MVVQWMVERVMLPCLGIFIWREELPEYQHIPPYDPSGSAIQWTRDGHAVVLGGL
jgi:hypothetical protein